MAEQLWKAMRKGLKSQYDGSQWEVGKWRKLEEVKELCKGFNASPRVVDAMQYVSMEILAKVAVRGQIIKGDDKWTSSQMRVIEAWYWPKEESVKLAIFAAELTLPNFEKAYPKDDRPRKAIEAAKAWLDNPTDAARSAAYAAGSAAYAARSAAYAAGSAADATWDAAYAALSAAYAAESAAGNAAWDAAYAARSAAYAAESAAYAAGSAAYAARSAAGGAAGGAARSAARCAESAAGNAALDKVEAYIQSRIPYLKVYEP